MTEHSIEHEYFMRQAIDQANLAEKQGEVPVGAVLVADNKIVSRGFNQSVTLNDPSAHAEIQCLRGAGTLLKNYRFPNTTLYVTLEPCPMCAGALVHGRVATIVYGASDFRFGALDSHWQIGRNDNTNHRYEVISGILAERCAALLSDFFKSRR